jgi:hypothetical protein
MRHQLKPGKVSPLTMPEWWTPQSGFSRRETVLLNLKTK